MAFDISGWAYAGGSDKYWTYTTASDNKATVKNANYFNSLIGLLQPGNVIKVDATDGDFVGVVRVSATQTPLEVLMET